MKWILEKKILFWTLKLKLVYCKIFLKDKTKNKIPLKKYKKAPQVIPKLSHSAVVQK